MSKIRNRTCQCLFQIDQLFSIIEEFVEHFSRGQEDFRFTSHGHENKNLSFIGKSIDIIQKFCISFIDTCINFQKQITVEVRINTNPGIMLTFIQQGFGQEVSKFLILMALSTLTLWITTHFWNKRHFYKLAFRIPTIKLNHMFGACLELVFCSPDDQFDTLARFFRTNPNVFKFWLGPKLIVGISKSEHMGSVLWSKNCIQKSDLYDLGKIYVGEGLFTAPVTKWKRNRKLINPTFNLKILNNFVPVFCEKSDIMIDVLEKNVAVPDVDIPAKLDACILDITCQTIMGFNTEAQTCPSRFIDLLKTVVELITIKGINLMYHCDLIFRAVYGNTLDDGVAELKAFSRRIFLEQKQIFYEDKRAIEEGVQIQSDHPRKSTFLKLMLEVSLNDSQMTDEQILDEVNTMIVAGTSSGSIIFCCLMLAMHPEYQQKVYEETINILGHDGEITSKDLPNFTFLEMCFKETLRIFPVGPFVMRHAMTDFEIDDLIIPEGATILLSVFNLHRNPLYWKNPLKFDPYRFTPEEQSKMPPSTFLPFLEGPRMCIGQTYAYMAMKIMISKLIRRFEFKTEYKSVGEVALKVNIMLKPKHGYKLSVVKRK